MDGWQGQVRGSLAQWAALRPGDVVEVTQDGKTTRVVLLEPADVGAHGVRAKVASVEHFFDQASEYLAQQPEG